tara:strand:+ start:145 stop:537 length:393 start_codon:yes stop_codon:yes gene_type:complete
MTSRLVPKTGLNTKNTIARAGIFIVAELWTIDIAPAIPPPLLRKAEETGTIQAEHRFITGPAAIPLTVRLNRLPDSKFLPEPPGKINASVMPATTKAKVIPTATKRRYETENTIHFETNDVPSSLSIQNP